MIVTNIQFVDTDRVDKITKIITGNGSKGYLYIGNEKGADDNILLQSLKITSIVTVAQEIKLKHKSHMDILQIDIDDSPIQNISSYFEKTNSYISKKLKTGNVLVHCKMGISRSATIVIAYLISELRLSFKQALQKLKRKRPIINPNKGFIYQLQIYGAQLNHQKTRIVK